MSARSRAERLAKRRAERYERNREIYKRWGELTGDDDLAASLPPPPWEERLVREHKQAAKIAAEAQRERDRKYFVYNRERRNLGWEKADV